MTTDLTPDAREALRFQQYASQPMIEGVWLKPLTVHRALEGSFMEAMRLTDGRIEDAHAALELRQVSVSRAIPGRINAFHLHPKATQDELWLVLSGTLLVWLVDVRAESPTAGHRRKAVLSGEQPSWLHIPTGVAHGYRAGPDGALLLYAMNSQFDLEDPNEGRLDWDFFGPELWEDDRG